MQTNPTTKDPKDPQAQQAEINVTESEGKVENIIGERIVHIYLEETFNMTNGNESDLLDLIIEFETCGQKKHTRVQKKVAKSSQTYWGQHFFFEKDFEVRNT
jgi:hypothetical protein